jgi:1-deoxy-D-xylulose-5-phosphate synthase
VALKAQPVQLEIGKAEVLRDGSQRGERDVVIFALGAMVAEGERLSELLESQGQVVVLVNARFAKPVDHDCIARFANNCGLVITMEDHVLAGGFGSAVLESLSEQEIHVPVVRVGWPDQFVEHGRVDQLREKWGLTAEAVLERARPYLKKTVAV